MRRIHSDKTKVIQLPVTGAIRTQILLSKHNQEITKITIIQNTREPSEQLFPKRWPLSNTNRTTFNINKHTVSRYRNSDPKKGNREQQQNYRLGTVSNELLWVLNQFYGANLALSFCSDSFVHRIRIDGNKQEIIKQIYQTLNKSHKKQCWRASRCHRNSSCAIFVPQMIFWL